MRLIAIVGMTGSGKSELSKLFEEKGYKGIRFGDITEEFLKSKNLEVNEANEKKVREGLREKHGMDAYAKLNLNKIQQALQTGNVVLDGLYSWEEYLFLKEKFGDDLVVVAIYASPEIRYERLTERENRPLTKEQAKERDFKEIENLNKAAPIAMADYTILNIGTLYDLKDEFDEFLEWVHEKDET